MVLRNALDMDRRRDGLALSDRSCVLMAIRLGLLLWFLFWSRHFWVLRIRLTANTNRSTMQLSSRTDLSGRPKFAKASSANWRLLAF